MNQLLREAAQLERLGETQRPITVVPSPQPGGPENPLSRVRLLLLQDMSTSMQGLKIEEVNKALPAMAAALRGDQLTRFSVEVALVPFNDQPQVSGFVSAREWQPVPLVAHGGTNFGRALKAGLDLLAIHDADLNTAGTPVRATILVFVSDGEDCGDPEVFRTEAANRVIPAEMQRRLVVFPLSVSEDSNLKTLAQLSRRRRPARLPPEQFDHFFKWLAVSTRNASASAPGESFDLPDPRIVPGNDLGWQRG